MMSRVTDDDLMGGETASSVAVHEKKKTVKEPTLGACAGSTRNYADDKVFNVDRPERFVSFAVIIYTSLHTIKLRRGGGM